MKQHLLSLGGALGLAAFVMTAGAQGLPRQPAAPHSSVKIVSPANGATVGPDVTVKFAVKGMKIEPAGSSVPYSGHYHLYIDAVAPPSADQVIPKDAQHLHFGKGETETSLHLAPGKHTLQLELGDSMHIPFKPRLLSKPVIIRVR